MPRIVVVEFLTLDGVMQAPGSPAEDRSGGFEHGGWQLEFFDDQLGAFVMAGLADTGGFLLGRKTYDIFAAHWPKQPPDDPLAGTFNMLPKWVVSRTLREPLGWRNSTLIGDDVLGDLERLHATEGKEIQVIGSGELVRTLAAGDLVDEYRLMIHPLLLGTGKRLFGDDGRTARLKLLESKSNTTGVQINRYVPERGAAASDRAG
jgi:dihydrofolate reductase